MYDLKITTADGTEYSASEDLESLLKRTYINVAKPKITTVKVPYRNGALDLTDSLGAVRYDDKELIFYMLIMSANPISAYSKICRLLNGKIVKIRHSEDPNYYHEGRCTVDKMQSNGSKWEYKIYMTAYPFKRKINNTVYSGTATTSGITMKLLNSEMPTIPTFTLPANSVVTFKNKNYSATKAGSYIWKDIVFNAGENTVTVKGSGSFRITYREGAL